MSQRNVTVLAGVSGSGKSSLAIRYLLNARLAVRFLFDSEFSERDNARPEFAHRLALSPASTDYELSLSLCRGWVAYDPHQQFAGRVTDSLRFFCEWAWVMSAKLPGEKILVVDELWRYCTPQAIPTELATVIQSGRKRGLHLLALTQEPNRLNSSVTNGASEFVCFRLQSRPALDLVETLGFDPAEISSLAPLQCVARNLDSGGELRGRLEL